MWGSETNPPLVRFERVAKIYVRFQEIEFAAAMAGMKIRSWPEAAIVKMRCYGC